MNPLLLLIASLPFCDFLQNGFVAFAAPAISGGLGASPEEYALSASAYAVAAIASIALHRVVLNALGWRPYLLGTCACFAAGALACASSDSPGAFTASRMLMGVACGPLLTAGRVLVQAVPAPRRFTGLRFFAAGLAWGAVAGPLLASLMLGGADWRTGFRMLALAALVPAVLAVWMEEPRVQGSVTPPLRMRDFAGLALLAAGSFALLHSAVRAAFDFFSSPDGLYAAVAFAVPALGVFVYATAHDAPRVLALRQIAQRRYLAGLAVFALAYVLIGADNTALVFVMRSALDMPLETVAADVGLGAVGGVVAWIVLSRLLPRYPRPWPYYAFAFMLLAFCATEIAQLSEAADFQRVLVPALLCHGAFMVAVLSTTAMQTFQSLQAKEEALFSHANQVKNMVAQLGLAAGTAFCALLLQWRSTFHYAVFSEHVALWSPATNDWLDRMAAHIASTAGPANASRMALAQLASLVQHEALFAAATDYFQLLAWAAGLAGATAVAIAVTGRARSSLPSLSRWGAAPVQRLREPA
ncbi:MAG: MFS transporter [Burkholderiales bacterium]